MEFIFRHTSELSEKELSQIADLFESVFEKPRPIETHLAQFVNNPLGYSYHSMIIDYDRVVGINTYVPVYFKVQGKYLLFANSIDSMVEKQYRDFFAYKEMVDLAYEKMKEEGVAFVYGYPNDNAYPVVIKSRLMKEIGRMYTYCLPIHIGGIKPVLRFLNPLTEMFFRGFTSISGLFASSSKPEFDIEKDAQSYNKTRYRRSNGKYSIASLKNGITVYYKIKVHEGVRTAFLIDISEKSPKAFNRAVNHIVKNHRKEFDILIYPGFLPFSNTGMIRIPQRFEPKKFYLTGKILDKTVIGKDIWDISNWDTNLSNYDLI